MTATFSEILQNQKDLGQVRAGLARVEAIHEAVRRYGRLIASNGVSKSDIASVSIELLDEAKRLIDSNKLIIDLLQAKVKSQI